ncbi:MAG: HAMP domain-containing sensor histidine kinase [Verrucomicrobiota bacterium]
MPSFAYSFRRYFGVAARTVFGFALIRLGCGAFAQEVELFERGAPPSRVFDREDFGGGVAVRNLAWADDGALYCGTNKGIVRYDGQRWKWIGGFEQDIVSLATGREGEVYYASFENLGVLKPDSQGEMVDRQFDLREENSERTLGYAKWTIFDSDFVYFVTTSGIFRLSVETSELKFVAAGGEILSPVNLLGSVYCIIDGERLVRFDGDSFEAVEGIEDLDTDSGLSALMVSGGDRMVCFFKRGYTVEFHEGKIRPETFQRFSKSRVVDHGFVTGMGSQIVVDGNMIHEFSDDAKFVRRLDVVISDFAAPIYHADLNPAGTEFWVSVGTRLVMLDLEASVTRYSRFHGIDGPILSVTRFDDKLCVFTARKLLRGNYGVKGRFREFEELFATDQGVVSFLGLSSWGVWFEAEGELALYDGERVYRGDDLDNLDTDTPYEGPHALYRQDGLRVRIFSKENGVWNRSPQIVNVGSMIYLMHDDHAGGLWLELGIGQVARLRREGVAYRIRKYGVEDGLTEEYIGVSALGDRCVFMSKRGLLEFDESSEAFVVSEKYNPLKEIVLEPWRIWEDRNGRVWARTEDKVGFINRDAGGRQFFDTSPFYGYNEIPPALKWLDDDGTAWYASPIGLLQCCPPLVGRSNSDAVLKVSLAKSVKEGKILRDDFAGGMFNESPQVLAPGDNSILIQLSIPKLSDTSLASYQYRLNGDEAWSEWRSESDIRLDDLSGGEYAFEARARSHSGRILEPVSLAFQVSQAANATRWQLAFLIFACLLLIGGIAGAYAYFLRRRNARLENVVAERTHEVESQKENLTKALEELKDMQGQLMESARLAGRAEVATSVLHNVGNVLNSIMVSINSINFKIGQSKVVGLNKAVDMLDKNRDNLAEFLTKDVRGSRLVDYLKNLNEVLISERDFCVDELEETKAHVAHAGTIIANQQKHAKRVEVDEHFRLKEVVEVAAKISVPSRWRDSIRMSIDVDETIELRLDQSLVLQILTNFVKNSAESIMDARIRRGRIEVLGTQDLERGMVIVEVKDNGGGIPREKLEQIFQMGFTTKSYGHGFGMHAVANHVKSMGGCVSIDSEGLGRGAKVTLELPVTVDDRVLIGVEED